MRVGQQPTKLNFNKNISKFSNLINERDRKTDQFELIKTNQLVNEK